MGHLTTIINRIKRGLKSSNNNVNQAKKNSLWLNAIVNLKEYIESWGEEYFTSAEKKEALELFEKYKPHLKGTIYQEILIENGWA